MESIYADRVETVGRHWHRPWLVFLVFVVVLVGLRWLTRETAPDKQIVCEGLPGSRYRGAVEIDGLVWTADLDAALTCAFRNGRKVFVAFHAITDTNARLNEVTVFRDYRAKAVLRNHILVMLYVDFVPAGFYRQKPEREDQRRDGEANYQFEQQRFQTVQEPLYVVLQPTAERGFEIVATYDEGRIDDVNGFVRFVRDPASAGHESR